MSTPTHTSARSRITGRAYHVAWLTGAAALTALSAACGSSSSSQPAPTVTLTVTARAGAPTTQTPAPQPSSVAHAPSPSGSPAAPSEPASGGGLAACRTAALRITVNTAQGDGAAGSVYYPLNFTNTSTTACEMYGYPGVSFVASLTGGGKQIGAAARRSSAFSKVAVKLTPGQTAHAWLRVSFAGNYAAATCHPVTAKGLRVYPPGETVPGYVDHTFNACSSTSAVLLSVLPVRAGQGVAGVTP